MGRALDDKLKTAYDSWKQANDDAEMVGEVHQLSEQFGKERPSVGGTKRLQQEELELICFEYVSA